MIISKRVKIKVNVNNINNLITHGYFVKLQDEIEIDVSHLSSGSHVTIEVSCDICGKKRNNLMYKEYLRNIKNGGFYSCKGKCSIVKNKSTCLEKWGVEFASQHILFKDKVKNTCLEKWGVDSYSKTDKFKLNFKNIMTIKYGVDNPSKSKDLQQKKKNTMSERHGVDHYVMSKDFKDKSEKTSLKNYGFKHPMMDRNQVGKMLRSQGLDFETNEYKIYRYQVDKYTKKVKVELFENWDGFDYYDREYIKDNLNLNGQHGDYPTIDHKISVYTGYKNNTPPEDISKIENLCITKRRINSTKSNKSNWNYNWHSVAE